MGDENMEWMRQVSRAAKASGMSAKEAAQALGKMPPMGTVEVYAAGWRAMR